VTPAGEGVKSESTSRVTIRPARLAGCRAKNSALSPCLRFVREDSASGVACAMAVPRNGKVAEQGFSASRASRGGQWSAIDQGGWSVIVDQVVVPTTPGAGGASTEFAA
jgi:hypothetical protein